MLGAASGLLSIIGGTMGMFGAAQQRRDQRRQYQWGRNQIENIVGGLRSPDANYALVIDPATGRPRQAGTMPTYYDYARGFSAPQFEAGRETSQANRMGMYDAAYGVPLSMMSTGTPSDAAYYGMRAGQRGALESYGDVMTNRDLAAQREQWGLNDAADQARGINRVLQYRMYEASQPNALMTAGQVIGGLGGSLGNYASVLGPQWPQSGGQYQMTSYPPAGTSIIGGQYYAPGMGPSFYTTG